MKLASLINVLEGCLQDELSAQRRTLGLLEAQERAIVACAPAELTEALESLAQELSKNDVRALRRRVVLERFAATWNVAPQTLTLSSIAERAGEGTERLLDLRAELRRATSATLRKNRRLAALSRRHRQLVGDLIQTVLTAADAGTAEGAGALVDAEA